MTVLGSNHSIHKPGSRQVRSLFACDLFYRLESGMNVSCWIINTACIVTILAYRVKRPCDSRSHQPADSLESSPESCLKNT